MKAAKTTLRGSRPEAVRLVLHDAPPHENPRGEIERVLEVEERAGFRAPCRRATAGARACSSRARGEGDGRVRERADDARLRESARERRREREDDQEGRPFREDDVLEEVDHEQVVHRDRLERGDRDREQEHHRRGEAGDPPGVRWEATDREYIPGAHHRDEEERLRVPRPPVRVHGATLTGRSVAQLVERQPSKLNVTGSSPVARRVSSADLLAASGQRLQRVTASWQRGEAARRGTSGSWNVVDASVVVTTLSPPRASSAGRERDVSRQALRQERVQPHEGHWHMHARPRDA